MDLSALLASVIASVATVIGGFVVARRFQKLGGGDAQFRLNTLRKELDDAMTEKLRVVGDDFLACKMRLIEVEAIVETLRTDADTAAKKWSRERLDFRSEITDLHAELRRLRTDRNGALDRAND